MSYVKVWLGGEGPSEIGNRDWPHGQRIGLLEALLLRIEENGWVVAGATAWKRIRKYRVGAARGRENHGDIHNIAGLVNEAFEHACEVVAFSRDVDSEAGRIEAIARGIAHARGIFPMVGIIGGPAVPTIEGWILALLNVSDTESMSRGRASDELSVRGIDGKHAEDYVEVVSKAKLDALPGGCDKLEEWLAAARTILSQSINGLS